MFINFCIARPKYCFIQCTSAVWQLWLNEYATSRYVIIFGTHSIPRVSNARCYASAVLSMALCLSVRLSVRHKSVLYRNGWTNRAGFWHVSFLPPVLHSVLKGNSVISKNKGTSVWNFLLNSGLTKFRHGISIVETCYQLSSRAW